MISPFTARHILFVTGSQSLYGQDVLDQVASQARRVAGYLQDDPAIPLDVRFGGVLTTKESIRGAILAANGDPECVGIIAWMHTFSPAKMWIAGLDALGKPLLHLHTQADAALPWSTIDMDFMNLNQAAHGDREFAYLETRLGVSRTTVVGHATNPKVGSRIGQWARAASAWAECRDLKLVRFGDNMRDVAVTEGDKVEAELVFGASVNTYGINDLADAIAQVSDGEVKELAAEYDETYDVALDLREGASRRESLLYAARQEIAMRGFLEAHGATAFTDTFEDLGALKQLPGIAVQRLMADGYGFGAEGDWKTAMLVRAAKVMGAGLPGGASLMEDYTYNLVDGEEKILGAHMLEVCPTLTTKRPSCEIHPLGIGNREDPVRLVFDADPGPAVLVGLADMRDRFRLVLNAVDVCGPDQPMPKLPVGRAVWKPRPDFYTSAESWLMAGGPHHTAMSTATTTEQWRDFAEMTGTELLVIDEDATTRQVANELRWNAAYYRLARGL